ncbi:hypothetical protein CBER1_07446 [Cercospora berteroae]|uniref:EKC/KEOPS complex subunit BUD32 n=1 Tax=Cercospora berteroae TaxID=357750 RepID=A0A2S6C7Z3_9PEZI|nr:hypothetical protein CBER1_07446 [Cercospora berteroae]
MKRHVLRSARLASKQLGSSQNMRAMGSNAKAPIPLPEDRLIEEERVPGYRAEQFLQVHPGDVLNGKYEVLTKLGYGRYSTVWLTKDRSRWFWQKPAYATVKVQTAALGTKEYETRQTDVEQRLTRSPEHEGYGFVRRATHHFTTEGDAGQKHLCQVFEPMREPITIMQSRFPDGRIPGPLLKVYIRFVLQGLDYLHSECQLVHTDLTPSNIMMSLEDNSVMPEFVKGLDREPNAQKVVGDRTIYQSQSDFGPLKSIYSYPQIHDFGHATLMEPGVGCRHPAQPDLYRAPEVMLGIVWSYKVDIWNLGIVMWELLEGTKLFEHTRDAHGKHSTRSHLANIIAFLGSPPPSLLQAERACRDTTLPYGVTDDDGETHHTFVGLYHGPFFLEDDSFAFPELVPPNLSFEGSITALDEEDKLAFIDFVKQMLCWDAEDPPSAQKLASLNKIFHLVNNIDSSIGQSPLPVHRKKERIITLNRTDNIMQGFRTYATAAKMATKDLGLRLTWYLTGTIRPATQVSMTPEVAAKALEEGFTMVPILNKGIEEGNITSANIQLGSAHLYIDGRLKFSKELLGTVLVALPGTKATGDQLATGACFSQY